MLTCTPGAKVMFLTNSMLSTKGIANGSIGVITDVLDDGRIDAAFPTRDGIQVITSYIYETAISS
jgi:ATP-dependent exoDNAse (exonuclease V) alpha subunit